MKVLDLRCANGHGFEGWFASDDDYMSQNGRGLIECPLCADHVVTRMPSAPRLNLSGAREPTQVPTQVPTPAPTPSSAPTSATQLASGEPQAADLQAMWLQTVHHLMANTDDVGERFAEEARRIHYGETPERGIRGQTTDEERQALSDEGIEVMSIPLPRALKGPIQ